ncbi:MAG: AAA family ATPase [Candidatus Marinimicrobia bacterium]|nr:AAA family ATPase [Candidatus Neomarinimicrobiota bacterium]
MSELDGSVYSKAINDRKKHVDAILNSKSFKKVVVAGPGTGKTFLFRKILEGKKNSLTLTFINSLVEDLSLELYGMSDVKTLHSFARSTLSAVKSRSINIFPKLTNVIKEDTQYILRKEVDFEYLFHNRKDNDELLQFYKKRVDYYNYYGYSSIIYALVKYFEKYRERIPSYDQILIDEFQDFNKLEVSLIDLLSEKSSILLAGDDDQALYEFKNASTRHIRERFGDDVPDYESFKLPFCARCTQVIVDATNDIIIAAKKFDFLDQRINKPFQYFHEKEKDKESEKYSTIGYKQIFASQIPWFIEKKISEMAKDLRNKFSVLIISPYRKQSNFIAEALKKKGMQNIECKIKDEKEVSLLDGFKLLLNNINDNLGWRIVSKYLLSNDDFSTLLSATYSNSSKMIYEIVDKDFKKEVKSILKILKKIKDKKPIDNDEFIDIMKKINIDPYAILNEFAREKINNVFQPVGIPAIRKIPIKTTTIQSSKGLSGDLVFITHFDDRYFIKDNDKTKNTDRDICNFLVALTRTKKKVYLISSVQKYPTFLQWINKDRIEEI